MNDREQLRSWIGEVVSRGHHDGQDHTDACDECDQETDDVMTLLLTCHRPTLLSGLGLVEIVKARQLSGEQ